MIPAPASPLACRARAPSCSNLAVLSCGLRRDHRDEKIDEVRKELSGQIQNINSQIGSGCAKGQWWREAVAAGDRAKTCL